MSNAHEQSPLITPISKAWGGGGAGNKKAPATGLFLKIDFQMYFV
jgi:hypothetical protein